VTKYALVARYYADDKDLRDFFSSHGRRLNGNRLREIAAARGLFFSNSETDEALGSALSFLYWSWPEIEVITAAAATSNRSEAVIPATLERGASASEISELLKEIETERADHGEVMDITVGEGRVTVKVEHVDFDPGRDRLSQKTQKTSRIEIDLSDTEVTVRRPTNGTAEAVTSSLISKLIADRDDLVPKEVTFAGLASSGERNEFFLKLMDGVEGCEYDDLKDIAVHRMPVPDAEEEDEQDAADTVAEGVAADIGGDLRRAVLSGNGLKRTAAYQRLIADPKHFVSKTVWTVDEVAGDRLRVEYEAGFRSPKGREFAYKIRSVRSRPEDGGELEGPRRPTPSERHRLAAALVAAAHESIRVLTTPADGGVDAAEVAVPGA